MEAISLETFEKKVAQGGVVIDTRPASALRHGFIRGSLALRTLSMLNEYRAILSALMPPSGSGPLLVLDPEELSGWETGLESSGVGAQGYLAGGFENWRQAGLPLDLIIDVEPDELIMDIPFDDNLVIIDIRPALSFAESHLKDAVNIPLAQLASPLRLAAIEDQDNIYLIGSNDEDAFLAATLLKKHDIHNFRVVLGGWPAVLREKKATIVKEPGMLN